MTKQTPKTITHPKKSERAQKQKPSQIEAILLGLCMAIIIVFILYTQGVVLAFWPFWVLPVGTLVAGTFIFAGKMPSSVARKGIITLAFLPIMRSYIWLIPFLVIRKLGAYALKGAHTP